MYTKETHSGFTLIELIIALSILALLTAYALPNYQQFKQRQLMTQEINRLASTINFARNQSIISGQHVILCPTTGFQTCDGNSQWHRGWMVFSDVNRNRQFDDQDVMLLNENKMVGDLTARSSTYRPMIRYDNTGFSAGTNITIRFCDQRGSDGGKSIIVSNVGRPRIDDSISHCG